MADMIDKRLDYFNTGFRVGTRSSVSGKKNPVLGDEGFLDYTAGVKAGEKSLAEALSEYQRHLVAEAGWPPVEGQKYRHCDDYIHDLKQPVCLRIWLLRHRIPAVDGMLMDSAGIRPVLYADCKVKIIEGVKWFEGSTCRVRLVMASRFGDVGITTQLEASAYEKRVPLELLKNFSEEP